MWFLEPSKKSLDVTPKQELSPSSSQEITTGTEHLNEAGELVSWHRSLMFQVALLSLTYHRTWEEDCMLSRGERPTHLKGHMKLQFSCSMQTYVELNSLLDPKIEKRLHLELTSPSSDGRVFDLYLTATTIYPKKSKSEEGVLELTLLALPTKSIGRMPTVRIDADAASYTTEMATGQELMVAPQASDGSLSTTHVSGTPKMRKPRRGTSSVTFPKF